MRSFQFRSRFRTQFRLTRTWERSVCAVILGAGGAFAADPWADRVVSYDPGTVGVGPYSDASVSIGSPERFSGEGVFPRAVSMFFPAFGTDEIVQIHPGGELVVAFDEPIVDDPTHLFGVDFSIFGNGGFADEDHPHGQIPADAQMFGVSPMRVSVSLDGVNFVSLGEFNEGILPAQGYRDVGPYSETNGAVPTDFTVPMDPSLTPMSFAGLNYAQALVLYGESGGGTPIDIVSSGLAAIQYVRVEPVVGSIIPIEIDAFATVPEPGSGALVLSVGGAYLARQRRQLR